MGYQITCIHTHTHTHTPHPDATQHHRKLNDPEMFRTFNKLIVQFITLQGIP